MQFDSAVPMVEEFIEKFGLEDKPVEFWETLIKEEGKEVEEAFANLLKETSDLLYVITGYCLAVKKQYPYDEQEEHTQRLLYLLNTHAPTVSSELFDIQDEGLIEDAFKAVHESNMSKLLPDGTVLRREEDGKVMKGPDYKPPNMQEVIEKYHD